MTNRLVDPLQLARPVAFEWPHDEHRPPVAIAGARRRSRATIVSALLAMLVAALVVVPVALAGDEGDDDGATTQTFVLASADTDTQYSLDGGATWQPAVLVTQPHSAWQPPVSAWIAPTANGGSGNAAFVEYRRFFSIPADCFGTLLTIQVNADNDATVYLNDVPFGSTVPVFAFLAPTEAFATVGPFNPGQNTLSFDVRNFGDPTSLDYRAEVTVTCDEDDDDGDDDGDDGDDDDDDDGDDGDDDGDGD